MATLKEEIDTQVSAPLAHTLCMEAGHFNKLSGGASSLAPQKTNSWPGG